MPSRSVPGHRVAVAARPDFAGLVVGDGLRIVAPGHGIDAGLFSANYYDPCIEAVWSKALRAHGRPPRRS